MLNVFLSLIYIHTVGAMYYIANRTLLYRPVPHVHTTYLLQKLGTNPEPNPEPLWLLYITQYFLG